MSNYVLDSADLDFANPQKLAKSQNLAQTSPDFAKSKNLDSFAGKNLTPQEYAKMEEFVKMSFDFARNNDAESLKIMLENGLNPNLSNHKGDSLLMLASYHNAFFCVRLLLDFGASVDKPNDRGHTPLAGVCFKGYIEVAELLLKAGANPNGCDENSTINGTGDFKGTARNSAILSPINTAIMFRQKEILALLLSYNSKKLPLWKRLLAKCMRL